MEARSGSRQGVLMLALFPPDVALLLGFGRVVGPVWYSYPDGQATGGAGFGIDMAAVGAGYRAHNGQAQSSSAGAVDGVPVAVSEAAERFEQSGNVL